MKTRETNFSLAKISRSLPSVVRGLGEFEIEVRGGGNSGGEQVNKWDRAAWEVNVKSEKLGNHLPEGLD
jgi:hypothetical protein